MSKQIIINVPLDPVKGTTIETKGFAGHGCQSVTAALEKALGSVTSTEITDEMYHSPQGQENQTSQ